ncbi:MAG TPA: DUF1427 family protein [Candidatus Binatia bacterium]|jgi:XapX domain-containing protein|nr:DUF1427 family protein [Candidatus Binatia bacterium]
MKTVVGFLLAFAIGALCRVSDVPMPAPPKMIGALLVVAITLGYLAADRLLPRTSDVVATRPSVE